MKIFKLYLIFIVMLFFLYSCSKDPIIDHPSAKLEFSADTILFDTVFATIGSITQRLKVYNRNQSAVYISSIKIGGGSNSQYTLIIDGQKTNHVENYLIRKGDSLYIMVEVKVNPNQGTFVVSDSILFLTNTNLQKVKLVSWGRDIYYNSREVINTNTTWLADKPHLIYNYLLIDSTATLTISAGAEIYFHNNSTLYINRGATLKVMGTCDDSVVFLHDRLEPFYKEVPGQWNGIHFLPGSKDNEIHFAVIKNGWYGIQVDSLPVNDKPCLFIDNTIIRNMASAGIIGYTAKIIGYNLLVSNCGQYLVAADLGGYYIFEQCTFANYNFTFVRENPSMVFTDTDYKAEGKPAITNQLTLILLNSIIWGSKDDKILDELVFDLSGTGVDTAIYVQNCLIRAEKVKFNETNIINSDPKFFDPQKGDFRIDSLSPAYHKGMVDLGIPLDLKCKSYHDIPSMGCYEGSLR